MTFSTSCGNSIMKLGFLNNLSFSSLAFNKISKVISFCCWLVHWFWLNSIVTLVVASWIGIIFSFSFMYSCNSFLSSSKMVSSLIPTRFVVVLIFLLLLSNHVLFIIFVCSKSKIPSFWILLVFKMIASCSSK